MTDDKDKTKSKGRGSMALQFVYWHVGADVPITPSEALPPMPHIPRGAVVIVGGRAPIWRYGMALHKLHGSPAGAIAFNDPKLGYVVVASHRPEVAEGQILDNSEEEASE